MTRPAHPEGTHRTDHRRARFRTASRRAVLAGLMLLATSALARRDRTVTGDVIKAARFLQTARLDDAKALLPSRPRRRRPIRGAPSGGRAE